jgi:cytochrome c-type biogenesis protein CcmE
VKPRHRRIAITLGALAALGTATALALNAFNSNLVFFYSPHSGGESGAP